MDPPALGTLRQRPRSSNSPNCAQESAERAATPVRALNPKQPKSSPLNRTGSEPVLPRVQEASAQAPAQTPPAPPRRAGQDRGRPAELSVPRPRPVTPGRWQTDLPRPLPWSYGCAPCRGHVGLRTASQAHHERENLGGGGDPDPAGTSSAGERRGRSPPPPSPPRRRSRPAPSPRNTSPNPRPRGVGGGNGASAEEGGACPVWGRGRGYSAPCRWRARQPDGSWQRTRRAGCGGGL